MAITSFYLLQMFPQMRTSSSSPNNQHPTPKPNMFPRMRTLHHHRTINTQHPDKTCSLECVLYYHHLTINTQHPDKTCSLRCALHHQSTFDTQYSTPKQNIFSKTNISSSPNIHHPTTKQNMFPQMRTLLPLENYFHEKK